MGGKCHNGDLPYDWGYGCDNCHKWGVGAGICTMQSIPHQLFALCNSCTLQVSQPLPPYDPLPYRIHIYAQFPIQLSTGGAESYPQTPNRPYSGGVRFARGHHRGGTQHASLPHVIPTLQGRHALRCRKSDSASTTDAPAMRWHGWEVTL
jgi:hypothetical protein